MLGGLAVAPFPSSPAAASCVAPQLSVAGDLSSCQEPIELRRGDEVTVDGRYFHDGCDDSGGGDSFGCSSDEPELEPPLQDVELEFFEKAASTDGTVLGAADADDESRTSWTFVVPADAPLGRGVLRAAFSDVLFVVVR